MGSGGWRLRTTPDKTQTSKQTNKETNEQTPGIEFGAF